MPNTNCNCRGSIDHEYGYNAMLPMQALQPTGTDVETLMRYCDGKNPVAGCNPNNLGGCYQCCVNNCENDCKGGDSDKHPGVDCQTTCYSLCKQSKPPTPIGPDGQNAADYCSTQVHPNSGINCHHILNGCCIHACHGNQNCISTCNNNADHCCTSECNEESPPYFGRGKRGKLGPSDNDKGGDDKGGDDKGGKGGDDKGGDDKGGDDKGGDDKGGDDKGGDDKGGDDKGGKGGDDKGGKGGDDKGGKDDSPRSQAFQDTTIGKITLGVGGVVLGVLLILVVMNSVKRYS